MREFKMPPRTLPGRRHDSKFMLWVSLAALAVSFSILFLIANTPGSLLHRLGPPLVWALVLIVLGALGMYVVVMRRKFERLKQSISFVLEQEELVRRIPARPDVRIPLPQIKSLHEKSGCLVVTGGDPVRTIAVPRKVENFDLLRTELLKHAPLSSPPWSYRLRWITLSLFAISALLLIWSENPTTIRSAAAVFVVFMGWESFKLHRLLRHNPKPWVFWLMIASIWLSTGYLIYVRIFGGSL